MSYLDVLTAIKNYPMVRLGISAIPNAGIGVFAVTTIIKDTLLFTTQGNYTVPWQAIPEHAIEYLKTICHTTKDGVVIDCEPNKIYTAYYVNHSINPNLHHDSDKDEYWAIRDINVGEELTCYYLPKERNWNVPKS